MYFRFIKVNFSFTKGEGKRRKLSFPSTVNNFRPTFRSPRYSFIVSYDAKNELKMMAAMEVFLDVFQCELGARRRCQKGNQNLAIAETNLVGSTEKLLQ